MEIRLIMAWEGKIYWCNFSPKHNYCYRFACTLYPTIFIPSGKWFV